MNKKTTTAPIPAEKWVWLGRAGHFIMGDRCLFHLCTVVGDHLISSVGDCRVKPDDEKGMEIGVARTHETYVFETLPGFCDCGCGRPNIKLSEIDGLHANDDATCAANHMTLCRKYA